MAANAEFSTELERINAEKTLNEVQRCMLEMLRQLIVLFRENGITYYMIGGTLLGAMRHKGFIPWDDDIDLAIPREDYEKLLEICKTKLPENFKLRTYYDDSYHHYYFSRIVDTRYQIRREGSLQTREEELWIDLFPLDGLPRNKVLCAVHKIKLLYLKLLYHFASFDKVNLKRPNRPLYQRLIIRGYMLWPFKLNGEYKKYLDKIDRQLKKAPLAKSDYYMEFMGSSVPFRETLRKGQYGEGKPYEFEGLQVMGPVDAEFYLSHVYGDWMTLPPEDKRNYHAAMFVKSES